MYLHLIVIKPSKIRFNFTFQKVFDYLINLKFFTLDTPKFEIRVKVLKIKNKKVLFEGNEYTREPSGNTSPVRSLLNLCLRFLRRVSST